MLAPFDPEHSVGVDMLPAEDNRSGVGGEGAILQRVGEQLMQCQGDGQRGVGAERDRRALGPDALASDEMMELVLDGKPVPEALILKALRKGTLDNTFTPVHCGSSKMFHGVQHLLDLVVDCLPNPLEKPPVSAMHPKTTAASRPIRSCKRGRITAMAKVIRQSVNTTPLITFSASQTSGVNPSTIMKNCSTSV